MIISKLLFGFFGRFLFGRVFLCEFKPDLAAVFEDEVGREEALGAVGFEFVQQVCLSFSDELFKLILGDAAAKKGATDAEVTRLERPL